MTTPSVALGERERERRLAAGGRPCDERDRRESARAVHRDADSSGSAVASAIFRRRRTRWRRRAARRRTPAWLDEGDRGGPGLRGCDPAAARAALEGAFGGVDVVVQPAAGREKRLLVADMDSTMITVECIDELADYAGIKAQIAAVTEAAMRGELDFAGGARRARGAARGAGRGRDRPLPRRAGADHAGRVDAGADDARARRDGACWCRAGSRASPSRWRREIGFDRAIANVLLIEGGRLTGRGRQADRRCRDQAGDAARRGGGAGIGLAETLAVGDGANDLPMMQAAGLGVAYRAKPVVAAAAGAQGGAGRPDARCCGRRGSRSAEWVTD